MARFKTKLSALETLKKNKENIALMDYVRKQKDVMEKIEIKNSLMLKLRNTLDMREKAPSNHSNSHELNLIQNYIDGLKQKILKQMHIIQVAQKNTEKSKISLLEKTKDKKIVSKLIDLRKNIFIKAKKKKEYKELSEVYIIRKLKNNVGVKI